MLYAKGCNANDNDKSLFAEAVETAKSRCSDYDFRRRSRNEWRSKSRSNIHFFQEDLKEIHKTGKPIILMINAGRPLVLIGLQKKHSDYCFTLGG